MTFSCYHRRPFFTPTPAKRIFESALERVRRSFGLRIYGYVIMPDHVHLLASEPERGPLADALKSLKQGVSRRLIGDADHFWQKRYYDFNLRAAHNDNQPPCHSERSEESAHGRKIGSGAAFVST